MTAAVGEVRRFFAEEIRVCANIQSARIVDALATVPRERFLPPGPWRIRGVGDLVGPPRLTDGTDPRHVYHDIAIAIDDTRNLYNGQPSLVARWFEDVALAEGQRVVLVGCATGYFTALIAHVVGPAGHVQAIDIDGDLAAQARVNVSHMPWVDVRQGNGGSVLTPHADVVIVHAGATHVLDSWLDALVDGGRLLVPLTPAIPGMPSGISKGVMALVTRKGDRWTARVNMMRPVVIYSLQELRDEPLGAALGKAMMSGMLMKATRVRRDRHEPGADCVVHGTTTCLSA